MKPYFHEQAYEQVARLTPQAAMAWYRQPDWCTYPDALNGLMGCMSLISGKVKDKKSCSRCDCFRNVTQDKPTENNGSFAQG